MWDDASRTVSLIYPLLPYPRVHALYYTNKICSEPLTPAFHLSDMRRSVKGYTEQVARVLKTVVLAMQRFTAVYQPFMPTSAVVEASGQRESHLASGLPYMLMDER